MRFISIILGMVRHKSWILSSILLYQHSKTVILKG